MDQIISSKNFRHVSGIEISKGEAGVVKALQKLWQKLQILEQARHVEKAEIIRGGNDWTLTDVQQRLLELQLQYVRSILHQNNDIDTTSMPHKKMEIKKGVSDRDGIQLSSLHEYSDHIPVRDCYDKHTQTDSAGTTKFTNSLYSDDEISPVESTKNPGDAPSCKKEFISPDLHELKVTDERTMKPYMLNVGLMQKNSRSHYHLRLSDVPFIIGTSTSSHSVVANVQKIISMMKVHNKGLCSSAPNLARRSPALNFRKPARLEYKRPCSTPDLSGHWDLKNILLCLTDELKTLTLKLENMKKIPENSHSCKLSDHFHEDYANTLNLIELKTKQIAALHKVMRKISTGAQADMACDKSRNHMAQVFNYRQHKAISESSPCSHYNEKLTTAAKDFSSVNRINRTEVKQVICSFSDAPYKFDISDRRKMMRELKEFQVHLQHEDIHWK